jgi:predicted alpha/beta superfamily hydrolase
MRLNGLVLSSLAILLLFSCRSPRERTPEQSRAQTVTRTYARSVGDSFTVYVSLPEDYDSTSSTTYPVIYLTDANFFFEMMAGVFHNYAAGNLIPQVIVVGIGYRDFAEMDSLRDRDFTFPNALPVYEMQPSGGGDRFLSFISGELMPRIDRAYRCDTAHRVLMGHSLGGYFVSYTLLQQLMHRHTGFSGFVAASPSLYYNNYYLFQQLGALPHDTSNANRLRYYVTFGGLEDEEEADVPGIAPSEKTLARLSVLFDTSRQRSVVLKHEFFSNLGHMDMPIPSFIKGVSFVLDDGKQ